MSNRVIWKDHWIRPLNGSHLYPKKNHKSISSLSFKYSAEVKAFLKDAGVAESNMTSGIIARGVADLWNYGAGEGKLSSYFMVRATQLALKGSVGNGTQL